MEKKTFDISGITSHDDLNALSIALNEKEQVSHMKIGKQNITFKCIDIEPLVKIIQSIDETLVIREVIDGKKQVYDFEKARDRKYYFMFKNLVNEEDILTLVKQIEEDKKYKEVDYDVKNRVLVFVTDEKDVSKKMKNRMNKINPSIEVSEHRRPVRSEDVFQKKFIMNYLKIGLVIVSFALAIVTGKDDGFITTAFWMVSILLMGERVVRSAIKNILLKNFLHEDVIVTIGILFGVIGGKPITSAITMIIYMLFEPFRIKVLEKTFARIDKVVEAPEKGVREVNGMLETISLYDFEIGDILVVNANEMISIPGTIVEGYSDLNTYPNTGSYETVSVKQGDSVNSGDINLRDTLKIKIRRKYESANLAAVMDIAASAPIHQSNAEKAIKKFSDWFTLVIFVLALVVGVGLSIMNPEEYTNYINVAAVLLLVSGSFASEQSASLGMLAGFAKAFQQGIIIESSKGLDAINETEVIVYDTIDDSDMSAEEFYLLNKLSRLGRILIVFNDSKKSFEDDQYKIYNHISTKEKLEIIENANGKVAYIGDSTKDIECFQKSHVAISRGGIRDSKVVENSDIVLIDSSFDRLIETFSIAGKMRFNSIINLILSIVMKLVIVVLAVGTLNIPLWLAIVYEAIVIIVVMFNATRVLE